MYGGKRVYLKDRVLSDIETLAKFVDKNQEIEKITSLILKIDNYLPEIKNSRTTENIKDALRGVQECLVEVKATINKMLKQNFINKTATESDLPGMLEPSAFKANLVALQEKIIMFETIDLTKFVADVAKYKAKELQESAQQPNQRLT